MMIFGVSLGLIVLGGLLPLLKGLTPRTQSRLHTVLILAGCTLGLWPAGRALAGAPVANILWAWPVPGGQIKLGIDALSGLFLILLFIVSGSVVLYGSSYFEVYEKEKPLGAMRFFMSVFIASMVLVLTAQNAVLFLASWELMALSAFFLVAFENHELHVRKAALLYLVATHLGTLCLLAAFGLLGLGAGSFEFSKMAGQPVMAALATPIFILAILGFGCKAGFVPLHVWLPEAHPAAPSPVSALMSGVMIKTGIYGLVRVLGFFAQPPVWWGLTLGAIGILSGILGIFWALPQSDFKRLLAYSSIENVGIITLGLGIGYLGISFHNPLVALFGLTGALWHGVNHGLFKSTLFLGAGSILHATGTREMDKQGGLLKAMPWTGAFVLMTSVAICGLPPFNGFVSEWLIYLGAFHLGQGRELYLLLGAPVLALIGALALASFSKAFGIQFLGTARSERASAAGESDWRMLLPMGGLAASCLAIGLFPAWVFPFFARAAGAAVPLSSLDFATIIGGRSPYFLNMTLVSVTFLILLGFLVFLRRGAFFGKEVAESSTWGCGYGMALPRAQYTASSFVQFPVSFFRGLIDWRRQEHHPDGYFPAAGGFRSSAPDVILQRVAIPLADLSLAGLSTLRRFQHGKVQLYLVYMFAFIVALFLWKL